ncbi:MAG: protein kinase [Ruminococcus sp.]|nr:protein kinase [Ruminococcus sp.]
MNIKCYDCFQYYDSINKVCPHCGYNPDSVKREANFLPEGTLLEERYIIGRVCGFGGFGITYKAWDRKFGNIVAIKEYFQNSVVNRVPGEKEVILLSNSQRNRKEYRLGLDRHIKEARIIAKYVAYRNIVNVFNYFEENNTAYIVMEYLDGESLEKYLKRQENKKMDTDYALKIIFEVCSALKTIHKDGILHRDVSPNNIQICTDEKYKLYDFGAARLAEDEKRMVIVKPGYTPPEQYYNNAEQGAWTDIYALGATMYRMLTGKKPDESINRSEENDDMKEPIELNPEIPQYLNNAIMKAMAVDYHLRFQNIEELEEVLKKETKVEAVSETVRKKKLKHIFEICCISAFIIIGTGLSGFFLYKYKTENTLHPANINVWYISDDDSMTEALEEIRSDFYNKYPDININFTGYPAEEYEKQLIQARNSGNMPELFQSDIIDSEEFPIIKPESFISDISDDCFFLDKNMERFFSDGKIPIGFNAFVLYMNTTRCDYNGTTVKNISDIISKDGSLCIEENMSDMFASQFDPTSCNISDETEKFYDGMADLLYADTSYFFKVQSALPARSRMLTIESDSIQCRFCDYWSIGDVEDKNKETVAQNFLEFMLNDNSQDFLYIRRKADALPVNKNALNEYKSVYFEFEPLVSESGNCVF